MAEMQKISEYIDNMTFKKKLGGGVDPNEVYEAIYDLTSMYNNMLSQSFQEVESLKSELQQRQEFGDNPQLDFTARRPRVPTAPSEQTFAPREMPPRPIQPPAPPVRVAQAPPVREMEPQEPEPTPVAKKFDPKTLRHMNRSKLLDVLLEYSIENRNLQKELSEERTACQKLQIQLEDKKININKAGTIAEATFLLNGVVDATQAAAQQYLDNLQDLYDRENSLFGQKEEEARIQAQRVLDDAHIQSEALLRRTEEKCRAMEAEARANCEKARREADGYWDELSERLESFYTAHEGIKTMLSKLTSLSGGGYEK